jgi:hypothetical protein
LKKTSNAKQAQSSIGAPPQHKLMNRPKAGLDQRFEEQKLQNEYPPEPTDRKQQDWVFKPRLKRHRT